MSARTALVLRGRARELDSLFQLRDAAAAGHGGTVIVHGETGTGRTTLLTAVAAAGADEFTILTTRGYEPERPLRRAGLQRLLGPLVDRSTESEPAAVLRILTAAARERPVLCCVDDAHWLDPDTLTVLRQLSRKVGTRPIAILLSTCDGVLAPAELMPDVATMELTALDDEASLAVLADLVAEGPDGTDGPGGLAGDVASAVIELAGGNPRALVDLARWLTPEQRRGDAALPPSLPPGSTLWREYQGRLRRLPVEAWWLVMLAAADPELSVAELDRAARASGTAIAALAPAERANLVRRADQAIVFPQPLVRSIVYNGATFARRHEAHHLLADTLDPGTLRQLLHRSSTVDHSDDGLAEHLRRAAQGAGRLAASRARRRAAELTTDSALAADDLVAAARLAWEGGRPHQARITLRRLRPAWAELVAGPVELLRTEIDLRCGPSPRLRRPATFPAGPPAATLRAGAALLMSGACAQYADLARHDRLLANNVRGLELLFRADFRRAGAPLRRVVSRARDLDDPAALSQAALAAVLMGDNTGADRLAARAAELARDGGDAAMLPQALELVAMAAAASGHHDAAAAALGQALPLARATGQRHLATHLLAGLAAAAAVLGDVGEGRRRIREARPLAVGPGMDRARALIEWALAVLDLATGRAAEAMIRLRGLLTRRARHAQLIVYVAACPHLVEAAVRTGERRPALAALRRFERWAGRTGDPAWLALVSRGRALVAEDIAEAEHHYGEALALHTRAGASFDHARTQLLYGQELRRTRRPAAAREQLVAALATLRRFDAGLWIDLAAAELRATGQTVGPPDVDAPDIDATGTLTPQQLKIARLAAAGATNREVAAQLFLSPRTVDHHMRNIFVRLGIRSRFDLARLIL